MTPIPEHLEPILIELLLAVADDKLVLGHRNSDWTGLAPMLEEDIAFSSIAQDEIAHAQALYDFICTLRGTPGEVDRLALGRTPAEYRCAALVEVPDNFDWAVAIARQFFCDHFDLFRLRRLAASSHHDLAALASRLADEEAVHVGHVAEWVGRLARSTPEAKRRLEEAFDTLAPVAGSLAERTAGEDALDASGLYPGGGLFEEWSSHLLRKASTLELSLTIAPPDDDAPGGRHGVHTEHLAPLLDEMCEVFRIEPEAAW